MTDLQAFLQPTASELFFTRNDPDDPRLGEMVVSGSLEDLLAAPPTVVIFGVPDDRGIVNEGGRAGAAEGPREIRRFLYRLTPGDVGHGVSISAMDIGDLAIADTLEETHDRCRAVMRWLFANTSCRALALGGGHDIAFPHMAALVESSDVPVGVVNVDAHFDVRQSRAEIGSGSPFRRLLDLQDPRFRGHNFVEYGIQCQVSACAHREFLEAAGATIVRLEDCALGRFEESLALLEVRTKRIGLSFDMDSVQMCEAMGVSAPSVTGLDAEAAIELVQVAAQRKSVRTLGIYETSPPLDNGTAVRLAARLAYEFLLWAG